MDSGLFLAALLSPQNGSVCTDLVPNFILCSQKNRETCYIHVKLELFTVLFKIKHNTEAGLLMRKLEVIQVWN